VIKLKNTKTEVSISVWRVILKKRKRKWENTNTVAILDPKYNNEYHFNVYKVIIDGKEYEFAAGEVSNNVWCFYLPKE